MTVLCLICPWFLAAVLIVYNLQINISDKTNTVVFKQIGASTFFIPAPSFYLQPKIIFWLVSISSVCVYSCNIIKSSKAILLCLTCLLLLLIWSQSLTLASDISLFYSFDNFYITYLSLNGCVAHVFWCRQFVYNLKAAMISLSHCLYRISSRIYRVSFVFSVSRPVLSLNDYCLYPEIDF